MNEIDQLLVSALQDKKEGLPWRERYSGDEAPPLFIYSNDWNEVFGELYAAKSACMVSHSPIYLFSGLFIGIGVDGGLSQGVPFFLMGIILIPIDCVQLPIQLLIRSINHLSVSDEELALAIENLRIAREYGFSKKQYVGEFLEPLPYYLDQIYDSHD